MFRLSSLGRHQIVSHYRGKYTIYGIIRYVTIKIIMTERDLFLSIKVSNNIFSYFVNIEQRENYKICYKNLTNVF